MYVWVHRSKEGTPTAKKAFVQGKKMFVPKLWLIFPKTTFLLLEGERNQLK